MRPNVRISRRVQQSKRGKAAWIRLEPYNVNAIHWPPGCFTSWRMHWKCSNSTRSTPPTLHNRLPRGSLKPPTFFSSLSYNLPNIFLWPSFWLLGSSLVVSWVHPTWSSSIPTNLSRFYTINKLNKKNLRLGSITVRKVSQSHRRALLLFAYVTMSQTHIY